MTIYPEQLVNFLDSSYNNYIPRKMNKNDRLHLYKKYWTLFNELYFKVINIYDVNGIEYYSVQYRDMLYGEISYPIPDDNIYELVIDKKDLENTDIINDRKAYTGAEIKYWFYIHNIDLESPKYQNFAKFIYINSNSCISDNHYYKIYAHINKNGIYEKCKIVVLK